MDRLAKEEEELRRLHPAAARAAESAGRDHSEAPDPWRTCWERDRDRIIHCTAFRRLEYKTQVFVNHVGDHHRTRLTHSLEVQQVARSLAGALDLNVPLVEAVALGHDLGHPPYGHAGEKLLDERMRGHGGFSHNRQALRVVEVLERRNPAYKGLNLTVEVRQCLQKHEPAEDETGQRRRLPLLEAQVVDLADSTAYHYHDVEDGVRAGILDPRRMEADLELWARAAGEVRRRQPGCAEDVLFWRRVANELLGLAITDLLAESRRRLEEHAPPSARAARELPRRCIGHSETLGHQVAALHAYLYEHMYYHDAVHWHVHRATELLERVWDSLERRPDKVPARFQEEADCLQRAICDYLAGMTDRFVERVARDLGVLPG